MTDLKREDVARVLADAFRGADGKSQGVNGLMWGAVAIALDGLALRLDVYPEFESALKALEKEQGRG